MDVLCTVYLSCSPIYGVLDLDDESDEDVNMQRLPTFCILSHLELRNVNFSFVNTD